MGELVLKCTYCGSENPDDREFCGGCGYALKTAERPSILWRKRLARQTAYIIILISLLLIVIAFGIKNQADDVHIFDLPTLHLKHALIDIAWLFGLLGLGGFPVAGLAYLFSLPTTVKKKAEVKPDAPVEHRDAEDGSG